MGPWTTRAGITLLAALVALAPSPRALAQGPHGLLSWPIIFPEQRQTQVRDPAQLPQARLPDTPPPTTVIDRRPDVQPQFLSLDEAIRLSLANTRVVRVLSGTGAVVSGRTIFDTQIANTAIDEQTARFDPNVTVNNSWNRTETPLAMFDPLNPGRSIITGTRVDSHNLDVAVTKQNPLGGTARLGVNSQRSFSQPGVFPLNPQTASSADLSYVQPLLRGAGRAANLSPIVVARIDTERSYFQFKDSMQEHVRGVVQAYWDLVAARIDVWARRQQVDQSEFAFRLADARFRVGIASGADRAQTRVTLANFRANLVTSEATLLEREAALRNILGLPPSDPVEIVPVSPPNVELLRPEWRGLIALAEQRRPDLIELKLIIEADQQLLIQADNNALPQLDAVALYRWNGLEGEMPDGNGLASGPGQFTDWTLGVNFSVPVGMRAARAGLRRQELIIARDRANLDQGLHAAVHTLASSVRTLDQTYQQYRAFVETREAARINLDQQFAEYRSGRVNYLNVLLAITDWGNAISNEAVALSNYNSQLAVLERQTGTILEAHGIVFYEERYGSIGPLGRAFRDVCYPSNYLPTPNDPRYPVSDEPVENSFNLQDPTLRVRRLPRE